MRQNIEEYIESVINDLVRKIFCSQSARINTSNGKNKGEGYLANILRIDVNIDNGPTINMLAKITTRNRSNRTILPIDELYENEVQFYEKILPALENIQQTLKVEKIFDSIPKFFTSGSQDDDYFIILENLKELDYEMFDFQDEFDDMHCRKICETFGKFHGLSFGLKYTEREKYNGLIEKLQSIHLGFMRYKGGFLKMNFQNMQRALKEIGKRNRMIDYYVENVESDMRNIIMESRNDPFSCILHCDGWTNNFMFRYSRDSNGTKIIEDFKLIDWQNCYVGSPVLDLAYFFYAGAPKTILDNLNVYLRIYYESLTNFQPTSSVDLGSIYPFKVLEQQWRKYCPFGVILGSIVAKIRMTKPENVTETATFEDIINAPCYNEGLLRRIEDISEHLEEYFSLDF